MRGILILGLFLITGSFIHAQGNQTSINVPITSNTSPTQPALLHLPVNYNNTQKNYPLLVFLHGAGEASKYPDLSKIYENSSRGGPAYFIANNQWPENFINPADGQQYQFIVLSPQATNWSTRAAGLNWIIDFMVRNYRVDKNRIYLTGVSAGGDGLVCYTSHINGNVDNYTVVNPIYKAAAIVPMSAAIGNPTQEMQNTTIADNVHVWGFGSESDIHGVNTHLYVDGDYNNNSCDCSGLGTLGRFTSYSGGHCCWNTFYDPGYREIISGKSMSIYEWMLQFSRGASNTPNEAPVANAGPNKTITLPTNNVSMNGSGTDADGTIASYFWSKIAGPSQFTISNPNIPNPTVSNLVAGNYTFRLKVTDNKGASDADDIIIYVNQQTSGTDKNIRVNIYGGSNFYNNSQWNNWNVNGSGSVSSDLFKYSDGTNSSVIATLSYSQNVSDNGSSYSGGMAPAAVLRHTSYSTTDRSLIIKGLKTNITYDLEFYSSRRYHTNEQTIFSINNTSVPVSTYNNKDNKAVFNNISPNSRGEIVIGITPSATYNYLNGFMITELPASSAIASQNAEASTEVSSELIALSPNPFSDKFVLEINNDDTGIMYLEILDSGGTARKKFNAIKTDPQAIQIYLSAGELPAGEYTVKVQMSAWIRLKKIVKK